jgi:putative ABC transport system permease protein
MMSFMARIAFRDFRERTVRSVLTVIGIAIAVGTFVAVEGVVRAFERALVSNTAAVNTHLQVIEKNSLDFLSSLIPEATVDRVGDVPGIGAASAMLVRLVPIASEATVPVIGWPGDSYLWDTITIAEGRKPQAAGPKQAVIGATLAKRLGAAPGGTIRLMGVDVTIVGVADTADQINRSALFLLLPDLQAITYRDRQITSIGIRLTPDALRNSAPVKAALEQRLPEFSVVDALAQTRDNILMAMTRAFSKTMSLIAVLLGFFGVMNTVWTSVRERRHEFAVMRAFGWPIQRIALFILCQSIAIAVVGFLGGLVLGYFGARFVGSLSAVSAFLEPQFEWAFVAWAVGACAIVSVLATLLPLWSVARTDPATILRSA